MNQDERSYQLLHIYHKLVITATSRDEQKLFEISQQRSLKHKQIIK